MNGFSSLLAELTHLDLGFGLIQLTAAALYAAVLFAVSRYATRAAATPPASVGERPTDHAESRLGVLEYVHGTFALDEALERLVEYVECNPAARPSLHCAVLLLEPDGRRIRVAAGSSLPTVFRRALEAARHGEDIGLCGPGPWHVEPVLATDLLTHPGCEALRPALMATLLRSCWTMPIRGNGGKSWGLFLACGDAPGLPTAGEHRLLDEAARLAAIAIDGRHTAAKLLAKEQEMRALANLSPDSIARFDECCRLICVNAQAAHDAGLTAAEMLGRTPSEVHEGALGRAYHAAVAEVLKSGRSGEFEQEWTNAAGEARHVQIRLEAERDDEGRVVRALAVGRDMTRIIEYRRKLHDLAYIDALTGLPNRARLRDLLGTTVADAVQRDCPSTLIVVGLDRFKAVNDTFGRQSGDALLRATGERLRSSLDPACVIARLEGDEFAILLPATKDSLDASPSPQILDTLAAPFTVGSMEIRLTASLGIAHAPHHGTDAEELLRCAEMALHHAKREGRGRARRYAPELTAAAQARLALEADLRKALEAGHFELHYQPKVCLGSSQVVGAEALLRWRHPERGLVAPADFIGLAEETGLITELGDWALRQACATARRWNEGAERPCPVAVNLSARQFVGGRLADRVRRALADTGARPEWIQLEITESLLLDDDPEIRVTLEILDALGTSLAIDDFGTGYSALAYLARFPIRTLKIDRSFIAAMVCDPDSMELVRAIVAMAHSLRMNVVAEGVESLDQSDFLKAIGCQLAQGHLYGRPMAESVFETLLLAAPANRRLLDQVR